MIELLVVGVLGLGVIAATMSLLVQGGTIGPLLRVVAPRTDPAEAEAETAAERQRIMELLRESAESVPGPPPGDDPSAFAAARDHRLAVIAVQRTALLDARDHGTFDADVLAYASARPTTRALFSRFWPRWAGCFLAAYAPS